MVLELVKAILELLAVVSVTVLTVLLPVYVIAFSLVGPSVGRRKEEMDRLSAEEAQANKEAIEHAKKALGDNNTEDARQKLVELELKQKQVEKERRKTERRYSSLGLKQALLYPSFLLILVAASFKFAVVLYDATGGEAIDQIALGHIVGYFGFIIVGLVCLVLATQSLVRTLGLIEELGTTVSEFNRQELSGVLLNTLNQWEKSKKAPSAEITLRWQGSQPPFALEKGGSLELKYELSVGGVNVVKDAEIWFLVPPGFEFKGTEGWAQGADRAGIANYMTTKAKFDKLQKRVTTIGQLAITSDNEPGTYKGYYEINSDEYVTEKRQEFSIIIQ